MACVVTATVAYNIFSPFSQKIDDLSFTFVTPLGAQYDVVTHFSKCRLLKNGFYHRFSDIQHFCTQYAANPTTFCSANRFPQHVVDHNSRSHKSRRQNGVNIFDSCASAETIFPCAGIQHRSSPSRTNTRASASQIVEFIYRPYKRKPPASLWMRWFC